MLDRDGAQIALRLVIVKRDGEVGEEGQHLVFERPEPVKQVADRTLLTPPASARGRRRGLGILGHPVRQQRLIASEEAISRGRLPLGRSGRTGVLDGGVHLAQQPLELAGPGLV